MLDEYIIVTTLCDKEEMANKIVDTLLEKRLAAGCQVSKVYSKYWWNNKLEEHNVNTNQNLEQKKAYLLKSCKKPKI